MPCLVVGTIFHVCDEAGIEYEHVLEQIPYSREDLENQSNTIDWDSMVTLFEGLAVDLPARTLFELAEKSYKHPLYSIYRLIGRIRFDLFGFYDYLIGPEGAVTGLYPISCEIVERDHVARTVSYRLEIDAEQRACPTLYKVIAGQLKGLPTFLGYKQSEVDFEIDGHVLSVTIQLPSETGILARLRRMAFYPIGMLRGEKRQRQTYDALLARNRQLQIQASQMRKDQDLIRMQRDQLRLIAENDSIMFWQVGLDMKLEYMSRSVYPMLGFTPDEVCGTSNLVTLPAGIREKLKSRLDTFMDGGEGPAFRGTHSLRLQLERKDGSLMWSDNLMAFRRDEDDRIVGMVGVTIDAEKQHSSEKREVALQEQLHDARQRELLGRVAGGIAHDFNNKLHAIIGFSEMVLEELKENKTIGPDLLEMQEMSLRSATSASDLVTQLLALGQKQSLLKKEINLSEWFETFEPIITNLMGEDVDCRVDIEAGLQVAIDPVQFERCMLNILINAREAMQAQGVLVIAASIDDEPHGREAGDRSVRISVADTGCGIPAGEVKRIFDPFYISEQGKGGSGLGLAVCAGIIEQHGGRIGAKNIESGGAVIEIHLPLLEDTAGDSAGSEKSGGRELVAVRECTMLVVDDREQIVQLATAILQREGIKVVSARNGREAIDLFRENQEEIGAVITDVVMPEMNGDVAVKRMREMSPELPVIFMTGYAGSDEVVESLKNETVLSKPFSKDELLDTIREIQAA